MPDNTIHLTIKLEAGNASQIIDQLSGKINSLGGNVKIANGSLATFDDLATKIGFRLQGFQNIINALRGTFGDWIDESNAGEAAIAKLNQALKNQGIYSETVVKDIQAYAAARQAATGIDDDSTVAVAAQLVAMGLQGQALKDAIAATQDLSSLMDGDLQSAVRVVADAFNGNSGMLGRYIKNLDEADIKQRGTISIIEQMQKAFGGQAEAIGNTGAGAIKKFNATLNDLKQSFGDLLKEALLPFAEIASNILKSINEFPDSMKILVAGITAIGIAFAFLNTQAGVLPYVILGIVSALGSVYRALQEGEPIVAAATASIGIAASALLLVNANSILASVGITKLIPAIEALNLSILTNPIVLLAAGLGALIAVSITYNRRADEMKKKLDEQREAGYRMAIGLDELNDKIKTMTTAQLDWEKANAQLNIGKIEKDIRALGLVMTTEAQEEKNQLDEKKKAWQDYYDTIINEEKRRASEIKKINDENSEANLEISRRRAEVELNGIKQRQALLEVEYKKELNQIRINLDNHKITLEQKNELERLAQKDYQQKSAQLRAEEKAANEKLKNEALIKNIEHSKELLLLEYDNNEKIKIANAKTEEEKLQISAEFQRKRIDAERDATIQLLDYQERIIEAQLTATKDPEQIRELKAELENLNKDIELAKETAELKKQAVDIEISAEEESRRKELDAENEAYIEQRRINQAKINSKKEMVSSLQQLDEQLDEAQREYAEKEEQYLASADKSEREKLKTQLERIDQEIAAINAKKIAHREEVEQLIEANAQAYNANEAFGIQLRRQVTDTIRTKIAQAVMSYIASIVEATGPLALVLAPAAGLAIQAALEAIIPKFAGGGIVQGSSGIDKVPAMLTAGEFVVRKDVAEQFYPFLMTLNNGRMNNGPSSISLAPLRKEISSLKKELKNMKTEVNIYAEGDVSKYDKLDRKMQRTRLAYSL
ncbi:MAG: hypothetical protein KBG83_00180 [Bacteroidetes bacterium]|nr:hypothetical protein [Bacteroidota bacterium]